MKILLVSSSYLRLAVVSAVESTYNLDFVALWTSHNCPKISFTSNYCLLICVAGTYTTSRELPKNVPKEII